jgi:hypothetical protein
MATGEVQLVKMVEGLDVDLGKVEIVDSAGTNTADVNDASATRATTTHVLAVQHIDAAGGVLSANPVLGAGAAVIGQVNASQVTSPWITENQYSYANVTASGATVVKATAGFLHSITFNNAASGVTTVIYDASGVGTIIGTVLPGPSAVAQGQPFTLTYDVKCLSGITASQVSGVATGSNLTFSYR